MPSTQRLLAGHGSSSASRLQAVPSAAGGWQRPALHTSASSQSSAAAHAAPALPLATQEPHGPFASQLSDVQSELRPHADPGPPSPRGSVQVRGRPPLAAMAWHPAAASAV